MNKITSSFEEISQLKTYEKIGIIIQIWHLAKFYYGTQYEKIYM